MQTLTEQIETVVAAFPFGTATAIKRGRRPEWPYVPVVDHGDRTEQLKGFAYATRDQAVAKALHTIEHRRAAMRLRLADPTCRAFREQHGLPRDIVKEKCD